MRHFQHEIVFDLPPARLAALMTDPTFLEADGRLQSYTSVQVTDLERTPQRVHLRIDQRGPSRDPRARGRDTLQSVIYDWDLTTFACTWRREPEKPDGVKVSGVHRLVPTPAGGCRYLKSWDVDVGIPLLGRVFEKTLEQGNLVSMANRK